MSKPQRAHADAEASRSVQCAMCLHFKYFNNTLGHNSSHALGKCGAKPWDGNQGQWPMFLHPCKRFKGKRADEP